MKMAAALAGTALAMVLAGCGSSEPAPAPSMANPASAFCVEQGGTVEIVNEDGGERGYCNLPDGTRVDEWEYFQQNSSPAAGSGAGIANPASAFCVDQGGTVEIVSEADGERGYCNLPDGTRIDEWEYFQQNSND
jgi:putative hemolysin